MEAKVTCFSIISNSDDLNVDCAVSPSLVEHHGTEI